MPIGEWPDFNSCVKAQIEKGHTEEVAKKICGKIVSNMKENDYHYVSMLGEISVYSTENRSIIEILKTGKVLDRNVVITEQIFYLRNSTLTVLSSIKSKMDQSHVNKVMG